MTQALNENWKEIPNFPNYMVSDRGRIKSLGRLIKRPQGDYMTPDRFLSGGAFGKGGYPRGNMRDSTGRLRTVFFHQAVMWAFVGPQGKGVDVRHLDGDPVNNTLGNLCYGTRLDNINDSKRHGTFSEGAAHPQTRLDHTTVAAIYASDLSHADAARFFKTSNAIIFGIRNRLQWRSVTTGLVRAVYASSKQRLTDDEVRAIFTSSESSATLVDRYDVALSTVRAIRSGNNRGGVTKGLARGDWFGKKVTKLK